MDKPAPVQPGRRFAAPQHDLPSRTERRNDRARQHRLGQLQALRDEQHVLALERQGAWATEVAHRDPHDCEVYIVGGGNQGLVATKKDGLRVKESEILEVGVFGGVRGDSSISPHTRAVTPATRQ